MFNNDSNEPKPTGRRILNDRDITAVSGGAPDGLIPGTSPFDPSLYCLIYTPAPLNFVVEYNFAVLGAAPGVFGLLAVA